MDLLESLKPTKISDFLGNKIPIRTLQSSLNENKNHIICLVGPDGCGKSTLCNLLAESINAVVFKYNNYTDVTKDTLKSFIVNKTIESFLTQKKRKVIMLDKIESIISCDSSIVGVINDLSDLIIKYNVVILMTCKLHQHKKVTDDFKKLSPELVYINYPNIQDVFVHLSSFDLITDKMSPDNILKLCKTYKGNVREIILNFDIGITDEQYKIESVFKDISQFDICKKLATVPFSIEELDILSSTDIGLIPYLYYENIVDELNDNFSNKKELLQRYCHINSLFLDVTTLEESMFANRTWDNLTNLNLIKFYGCTHFVFQKNERIPKKDLTYRFSQMISKMSHKNIIYKRLKNILTHNKNVSITMLMIFCDIFDHENVKNLSPDDSYLVKTYQKLFS